MEKTPERLTLIDAQVLRLRAGDVVAVRVRMPISHEQSDLIRATVAAQVPEGVKVLVLDDDTKLQILRPEQETKIVNIMGAPADIEINRVAQAAAAIVARDFDRLFDQRARHRGM